MQFSEETKVNTSLVAADLAWSDMSIGAHLQGHRYFASCYSLVCGKYAPYDTFNVLLLSGSVETAIRRANLCYLMALQWISSIDCLPW